MNVIRTVADAKPASMSWRRVATLLIVVALHAALLALFMLYGAPPRARQAEPALTTISIGTAPTPAPKPAARKPMAVAAVPTPLEPTLPALIGQIAATPGAAAAALAPSAPAGAGCELAGPVRDAIVNDGQAMSALNALHTDIRTAADAVMLWDGKWLGDDNPAVAQVLLPVRTAVQQAIAAKSDCAGSVVTGPQFMILATPARTITLVIGSGQWRWSDLLLAACPSPPGPCVAPPIIRPDPSTNVGIR